MIQRRTIVTGILAAGALLALGACANQQMDNKVRFTADLNGGNENPKVTTPATGKASVSYDPSNRSLSWNVTYTGLSGPATGAHFHGPAAPNVNAGVVVNIGGGGLASPITGTASLSEAQAADLMAGRWYLNVHTAKNPGGEIRGQVVKGN